MFGGAVTPSRTRAHTEDVFGAARRQEQTGLRLTLKTSLLASTGAL